MKRIFLYCVLWILLVASVAQAGTYWVSPSGQATTWANCAGTSPLSGNAACPLATSNANANAGDTIYLRGGTYNTGIVLTSSHNGNSASPILFKAYTGEIPKFTGMATAIDASGKSYITVDGVTVDGANVFANLANANHISILNSTLINSSDMGGWPVGVIMYPNSQYNRLINDTIGNAGRDISPNVSPNVLGGVLVMGDWNNPNDTTAYNLVENCLLYHGAHMVVEVAGRYNFFRNNTFHNENYTNCARPSTNNLCGDRDLIIEDDSLDSYWNVVEGNRFTFGSYGIDGGGGTGLSDRNPHTIIRHNLFYFNEGPGLGFYTDGTGTYDPSGAHAYNNVMYHNGFPTTTEDDRYKYGMNFDNVAGTSAPIPTKNVSLKNNLFYNNNLGDLYFYYTDLTQQTVLGNFYKSALSGNQNGISTPPLAGNLKTTVNPLFVNISAPIDVAHINNFDFHLQSGSPAIDQGVFLTTTTASGSGTVIPVADAGYFTNGFGVVDGDLIQFQGQTKTARIISINYTTNQLTVDTSLTWTSGLGLSLPYSGTAPDIGAYEFQATTVILSAPANFRVNL